ncbi:hypothetical protein [Citricoccus nitrophenolicus]|uniref:hypothetical protein n=1 Tax=Citricoccus nitrophenolicus TaxID=863575 RepID=UPI0031EA06D9
MRTLAMDLPEDWVRYPVGGFHLVAAAPVTEAAERMFTDGMEPGGAPPEPELAANIVATTYAGEPAGLCGLNRLYVVEDVTCTVGGLPARRMDLTRWTGRNNIFTRRWLVQEALAAGRATLEISASCLISDYQQLTAVFDAAIASARFTVSPGVTRGQPEVLPAEPAALRAVA